MDYSWNDPGCDESLWTYDGNNPKSSTDGIECLHGIWGSENDWMEGSFKTTKEHTSIQLKLRFWMLCSIDKNETAFVAVDDNILFEKKLASPWAITNSGTCEGWKEETTYAPCYMH